MREWLARAARAARDPAWVADGIVSDEWLPASPVNGRLDAFKWETPVERIGHRQDNEAPPILSEITTEAEPAPATFVVQQLELAGEGEEPTAAQSASQPSPELPPENSHEDSPASAQPVASPPAAIAAEPVAESIKPAPAMAALGIAAPPTRIEPQPTRAYGLSAAPKGRSSRAPLPRGLVTAPDDPGPDAPDPLTPPASQR
jgi:HemY protein